MRKSAGALAILLCVLISGIAIARDAETGDALEENLGVSVPLEELPDVLSPGDVVAVAKRLIVAGQYDPARRLLERVQDGAPDRTEVRFLLATIAINQQRYPDAVEGLRFILVDNPELTRVRLELARALFLNREDEASEHHFQLVLAAQPPGPVADNIRTFLDAIRARRTWRYTFAIAAAPDTNINVAPDDERVDLFGLPFVLSPDAQETSGVGYIVSGGVEYLPKLGDNVKLETNLFARHTEYDGATFDDTIVSAAAGPRWHWTKSTLSVQATGYYRWFGHRNYNRSVGGRIEFNRDLSRKWRLTTAFAGQHVDYFDNDGIDGPVYSFITALTYGLSSRVCQFRRLGALARS